MSTESHATQPTPTDAELVQATRAGQPRAFEQLVERHFAMVYAIAYARLGQPEAAEDLAQEVFLRAHLFLHTLAEPERFAAWLSRIARNEAVGWLRSRQRASRLVRMVPFDDAAEERAESDEKGAREKMSDAEEARAVHEALRRLTAEEREVVMLHYFEGLSQVEIAARLETHQTTIGRRLQKALRRMRLSVEPILRQAGPAFRPPRRAVTKTVALVGAASVLSAQSKAALVAAAGGALWAQSAALVASKAAVALSTATPGISSTTTAGGSLLGKILSVGAAVMKVKLLVVGLLVVAGGAMWVLHGLSQDKDGGAKARREGAAATATALSQMGGTAGTQDGDASGAAANAADPAGRGGRTDASGRRSSATAGAAARPTSATLADLAHGATLYGTVTLADTKAPVAGAKVWAIGTNAETVTRADGSYELPRVAPGPVRVAAEMPPFRSYEKSAEIPPVDTKADERLRQDLPLSLHPILSGVIRDKGTMVPVRGAIVRVDTEPPQEVRTAQGGTYRLEGLAFRTAQTGRGDAYSLQISSDGHATQRLDVRFTGTEDVACNADLEPGAEVEIRVVDTEGKAVAGAGIGTVEKFAYLPTGRTTDSEGKVRLGGASLTAPLELFAEKKGYLQSVSRAPRIRHDNTAEPLTLVLMPLQERRFGFVAGQITDAQGSPITAVTVRCCFVDETSSLRDVEAHSDEAGNYVVSLERPRSVEYLIAGGKGWAAIKKADLALKANGDFTEVNFTLEPGHWVAGVVVDREGKPMTDVNIQVHGFDDSGRQMTLPPPSGDVKTDSEGRFRAEGVPPGKVMLWIRHTGMSDCDAPCDVDQEHRIVLAPLGTIGGQVVLAESQTPVPDFTVNVATPDRVTKNLPGESRKFSSGDGRFAVGGLKTDEKYQITILVAGRPAAVIPDIVALPEDEAERRLFEIPKGTPLACMVVDEATGTPLTDIQVVYGFIVDSNGLLRWGELENSDVQWLRDIQRAVTGPDGRVSFVEAEEEGTLLLRAVGYQAQIVPPASRPATPEGQPMRIALQKGASLYGTYTKRGVAQTNVQLNLGPTEKTVAYFDWLCATDSQGGFHWDGLREGNYRISAFAGRGRRICKVVRVEGGKPQQVDFGSDLGPLTISGTVHDASGAPTAYYVTAKPAFDWDYIDFISEDSGSRALSEEGHYVVEGLRPGKYNLYITAMPADRAHSAEMRETIELESDIVRDITLHEVTLRIAFPEGLTEANRARVQEEFVLASGTSGTAGENAGVGCLTRNARAVLHDKRLTFTGCFQGQYRLVFYLLDGDSRTKIEYPGVLSRGGSAREQDGARTKIECPGVLSLDNLAGDQDLGEVRLQVPSTVKLQQPFP